MKPFLLLALLALSGPHAVAAGELTDLIMAPGLLTELKGQGEILRYDHHRQLPPADGVPLPGAARDIILPQPVGGGRVILSREGSGRLALALAERGDAGRVVAEFAPAGPNPIMLMFLEDVARVVSARTGGSPFYIRHRIRDGIVAAGPGQVIEGRAVSRVQPFQDDPNRSRLGDFANLVLSVTYDPADPARLIELQAIAGAGPDGYLERLSLISDEEEKE